MKNKPVINNINKIYNLHKNLFILTTNKVHSKFKNLNSNNFLINSLIVNNKIYRIKISILINPILRKKLRSMIHNKGKIYYSL